MKRTIVASLFIVLFCAGHAKAAGQLSFVAGYLNPGDLNFQDVQNNVQQSLKFKGTSLFGVRAEFDFAKVLGFEQNLAFSQKLFSTGPLIPAIPVSSNSTDLRGLLYSSNLVFNIPIGRIVPYATGGIGFLKPWGTGLKPFGATLAGNYGGGLKLDRLAGPVGVRFDVRGWRTGDLANRGSSNILEVSGGVTFSWSGTH